MVLTAADAKMVTEERREFQRLHLTKPLHGWFGDFSVQLLDISACGAQMLHGDELTIGDRGLLRFTWRGEEVELTAEVIRTSGVSSGVAFVDDSDLLRRLIEKSALEVLRAQEANASGDRDLNVVGDETLTAASAGVRNKSGYLMVRLAAGQWKSHRVLVPDQPEDGFTVSANESQEQIELLCRTYESGDDEGRRMTRMIAELSVNR